jgi:hypothetical protein
MTPCQRRGRRIAFVQSPSSRRDSRGSNDLVAQAFDAAEVLFITRADNHSESEVDRCRRNRESLEGDQPPAHETHGLRGGLSALLTRSRSSAKPGSGEPAPRQAFSPSANEAAVLVGTGA